MHFIWVTRYLAQKYLLQTLFLCLQLEMGLPLYVVIWATQRSSCLQYKGSTFILSYFKTLSIGSAPGIKPEASHSVVKCSTDWINPATVKKERKELCYKNKSILRRNSKCTFATICSCRLIRSAHQLIKHKFKVAYTYDNSLYQTNP